MAPSIIHLSEYLARLPRRTGIIILNSDETKEIGEGLPWKDQLLPWNGRTCLVVIHYVTKFISNSDHGILGDTIRCLDELARKYNRLLIYLSEISLEKYNKEIAEILVNNFMPGVLEFFKIPKMQELSEKDKSLEKNEVLAGFMDFLIQILNSEALASLDEEQCYALLRKELTFLLTFLGDTPFQCIELEEVNNLLAEFETLANEAGCFIYSSVFTTRPVLKASVFYGGRDSLLEKVGLLNQKIKEHCIKFSDLPRRIAITPRRDVEGSLFIVDSLLEDVENAINFQLDFPIDDIKDQIKIILDEMTLARTFLKDMEVVRDAYADDVKESSIQIRDVAYEAEYLINSYVVGNVPTWYLNLRLPTVIQEIKLIGMRLQEFRKIYDTEVLEVEKDFNKTLSFQVMETTMDVDVDVDVDDKVVVGFEDQKTKIFDDLTGGSKSRQIISIFGLPGLGKTTMAKELYNHPSSYDYFDERAWCVVSQTYQKKNVLVDIFMTLAANKQEKLVKGEILEMEDGSLGLEIYQSLKGRRYLVVVDDVWHSNMWDDLRRYLPDDVNGSRVILTSRIKDVAPIDSIFHPLNLLSEAQCWDLLQKKVFFEEPCPQHLLGIGEKIAEKCHGLPLAVVVIAGVLAKLEKEESAWKKVERNLDSYIFDGPNGCLKILEISYEYLPNHLKRCFLYFGIFPEDTEIPTGRLIWLWIAEGFIPKQGQKSPENVAEEYLSGLINRSLVTIVKTKIDGRIKTCNVHDLLRDMCLRKAHEENFLKNIKEEFSIFEKHQRVCVHSKPNCVRSFGLNCRTFFMDLSYSSPGFSHMPLLRVMDMQEAENLLDDLEEVYLLVNLRYFSIRELPDLTIHKLLNLEILCLDTEMALKLSVILKMVKLRHLYNSNMLRLENDCDETHQTTNLKSLGRVNFQNHEDKEILRRSPYLCKLNCQIKVARLFPDLCSLTQLESLKVTCKNPFVGELPKIQFPSTIKKLSLSGLALPWKEMSILGQLPNLHFLKLGRFAFVGEKWVTNDDEFQELRLLAIDSCRLDKWITSSEHFPRLHSLVFERCEFLKEIPSDLGNISTLHTIEVSYCSLKVGMSAVRIEQEQREYGNEELKVIINDSHYSKEQVVQESIEHSLFFG